MMGLMNDHAELRLYADLAPWWPLISAPEEYADEAVTFASLLNSAEHPVRHVLELGSGGGNNAVHLKDQFTMTLADISPAMLEVSRQLNPDCEHIQADMQTMRLDRRFDAVFVHDAIDYMLTESDLTAAIETAAAHCRDGGVALFVPDHTAETFQPSTGHGGNDAEDGRAARFLDWTWDPDPSDSWVQTEYTFVLRDRDGSVQVVHEQHRIGIFSRATWLNLLGDAGFDAVVITEATDEDRTPRDIFVGRKLSTTPS
jgi:SAM-dependent methyltransferase